MSESSLDVLYAQMIQGIYGVPETDASFIESGHLAPQEQLSIYRGSVTGGLVQALGDIYPSIKTCLGERFFDSMALKYVLEFPSTSYSLDHYGSYLPDFLGSFPPLVDFPYLKDLALLEWHWHQCFHAADTLSFDPGCLAEVDADDQHRICFRLPESMNLVASAYPLLDLWEINQPDSRLQSVDLDAGGQAVLIWREGLTVRLSRLNEIETALYGALKNLHSVGTIFADTLSKMSHDEVNAALATFMRNLWIVGYELDPNDSLA